MTRSAALVVPSLLLSSLLLGCSTTGSGGEAPGRTRGMRLPTQRTGRPALAPAMAEPMAGASTLPGPRAARPASVPTSPPPAPGELPRSVALLRETLRRNPADHDTRLKLARTLLSLGETAEAEAELRRLLPVKTHLQRARRLLLRLLRGVYRLEEAVKLGKVHVAAFPRDVEARKQLGMALLAWRARQAAATELMIAVKLAPGRADLWRVLGNIYLKWRKLKRAIAALKQAVRLDPKNPWPLTLMGDALWGQSRVHAAERAYRKAAGLEGGPPVFRAVALDKLGTLLVARHKRKLARRVFTACERVFPELGCPYTRAALMPANPVRLPAMRPGATYY